MKKLYKNAGIRIRFLREERHYTREYLAEMADISPKFYMKQRVDKKVFRQTHCIDQQKLQRQMQIIFYMVNIEERQIMNLGEFFNTFDDDKKRLVVKIMELICEFAEE